MLVQIRIGACALFIVLATSTIAKQSSAADNASQQAQEHYTQAKTYFSAGKIKEAMDEFAESYNLSGNADLLYNLAVCAEKLEDLERAKAYYEVYLEERPDAPDAADVRARLETLKAGPGPDKEMAGSNADSSKQAADKATLETKNKSGKAIQLKDEESTGEEPKATQLEAKYYEEEPTKVFWPGVTMALGGLVLAGGTVTAILAYKKYGELESGCSPNCTDDQISSASALAIASDVQFAVGAAAVVAGVFLWVFTGESNSDKPIAVRSVQAGLSDNGTGLVIEWRF